MIGNAELLLCVVGMILGTALPRALPMTILAERPMPDKARRWLSYVPAAILAALVAPDVLLRDGGLYLSAQNVFLVAAIPCVLVAARTKSLFITLALGMAIVALLRYFGLGQ